jgi:hypothetical protein
LNGIGASDGGARRPDLCNCRSTSIAASVFSLPRAALKSSASSRAAFP